MEYEHDRTESDSDHSAFESLSIHDETQENRVKGENQNSFLWNKTSSKLSIIRLQSLPKKKKKSCLKRFSSLLHKISGYMKMKIFGVNCSM